MIDFTMKIETENEILFRNVLAENPRQAIELTNKNLFWIVGDAVDVFSISVEKMGGLPFSIEIDGFNEDQQLIN